MVPLPFAASIDALTFIVRGMRLASADPACAELLPALSICFNSCSWEETTKRIIQYIPYEHYRLGWHSPQDIADAVEVQVFGRRLFVRPTTLEQLAGKRLVLRTVGECQSSDSGFERQHLIAVPLTAE